MQTDHAWFRLVVSYKRLEVEVSVWNRPWWFVGVSNPLVGLILSILEHSEVVKYRIPKRTDIVVYATVYRSLGRCLENSPYLDLHNWHIVVGHCSVLEEEFFFTIFVDLKYPGILIFFVVQIEKILKALIKLRIWPQKLFLLHFVFASHWLDGVLDCMGVKTERRLRVQFWNTRKRALPLYLFRRWDKFLRLRFLRIYREFSNFFRVPDWWNDRLSLIFHDSYSIHNKIADCAEIFINNQGKMLTQLQAAARATSKEFLRLIDHLVALILFGLSVNNFFDQG